MTTLVHFIHALSAAWAAAGELITAGAILWTLNATANLIRITYKAGCVTGRALWPLIHLTIAGIRWAVREIDWRLVATIVIEGLVVIVVGAWTIAVWSHRTLINVSEQAGRCFASLITTTNAMIAARPMVHPLANVAAELESLTCSQLRAMVGTSRKVRKAELIAMLLA